MSDSTDAMMLPPPLIAVAGWVIPGAGYWLVGERTRGIIVCFAVLTLYLLGLLIAGVRVIEVPGYDSQSGAEIRLSKGFRVNTNDRHYDTGGFILTNGGFMGEITSKPWYVGQILAGPVCVATSAISVSLARENGTPPSGNLKYPRPHAPLDNVATLYTAVAGMLNLLVIIDSTHRAGRRERAAA